MAFFTREEIIVCSKLVYIFFFNVRRVNSFLVTTCWIYEKHELKILKCISNTGILTQLNFKLYRTDKNLTSLRRNVPAL